MDVFERCRIIESLAVVDKVVCYPDADGSSKNTITGVRAMYPDATIVFANGGDRTKENIPEMNLADDNLEFAFGVGGENKANSSSWILEDWKAPKTERAWGYYRVLHEVNGMKVKELTVDPGKSLSMQRHKHRAEHWMVSEGACTVCSRMPNGYALPSRVLNKHNEFKIPTGEWHQLVNHTEHPCRIVEIQYGAQCIEEDIERTE